MAAPRIGWITLTRRRYGAQTQNVTTYLPEQSADPGTEFRGAWQQPTARQLQVMPEGYRSKDPRVVICDLDLRTASPQDATAADEVLRDGVRYKVVEAHECLGPLSHWEAVVIRVGELEG